MFYFSLKSKFIQPRRPFPSTRVPFYPRYCWLQGEIKFSLLGILWCIVLYVVFCCVVYFVVIDLVSPKRPQRDRALICCRLTKIYPYWQKTKNIVPNSRGQCVRPSFPLAAVYPTPRCTSFPNVTSLRKRLPLWRHRNCYRPVSRIVHAFICPHN